MLWTFRKISINLIFNPVQKTQLIPDLRSWFITYSTSPKRLKPSFTAQEEWASIRHKTAGKQRNEKEMLINHHTIIFFWTIWSCLNHHTDLFYKYPAVHIGTRAANYEWVRIWTFYIGIRQKKKHRKYHIYTSKKIPKLPLETIRYF